ncbi:hypothetical protein KFL_001160160 [Klebsormidium nitens]|uniref:Uncharacterized protein n=1 Tax=Klebsormidium nitens TaxID=105231 RepID=A0A1Y1HXU9_KLENI|nr:hypothetical protein KFL_001160160 [Klebsormidium nitens]|eukprot:GAQ82582.1 hypothetical protein KFL_001160160 [Klebsormidium nitens]
MMYCAKIGMNGVASRSTDPSIRKDCVSAAPRSIPQQEIHGPPSMQIVTRMKVSASHSRPQRRPWERQEDPLSAPPCLERRRCLPHRQSKVGSGARF